MREERGRCFGLLREVGRDMRKWGIGDVERGERESEWAIRGRE
jgi:hypothetical protein